MLLWLMYGELYVVDGLKINIINNNITKITKIYKN